MVNKQKITLLFIILLGLLVFSSAFALDTPEQLSTQALLAKIADNRGKVVLVNFWASWCPACRKELPELIAIRKSFSEDRLVILGVSLDQNPGRLRGFLKHTSFNYPIFRGGGELVNDFQLVGIPKTLVFDRQGQMIFSRFGYQSQDTLKKVLLSALGN